MRMSVISLIWGILAMVGMLVAFFPCLGSLNWLNIPFSLIGGVISYFAMTKATYDSPSDRTNSRIGLILCVVAVVLGGIRLIMG